MMSAGYLMSRKNIKNEPIPVSALSMRDGLLIGRGMQNKWKFFVDFFSLLPDAVRGPIKNHWLQS